MRAFRIRNFVFLLFFVSLILAFAARKNQSVAGFLEENVSVKMRFFLSRLTSYVPFSLFEIFVLTSPLLIFLLVKYVKTKERFLKLISFLTIVAIIYVYTVFVPRGIGSRLSEYDIAPTESELISAAESLISDINNTSESAPLSLSETSRKIRESYRKISHGLGEKYKELPPVKPLMASKATNYFGILALYAFPTSEICINTDVPRYLLPHTVAHEYSHLFGVSLEGEANFLAYVACIETDEPYIVYSASLSVLEYLLLDVAELDEKTYTELYNSLSERAKADIEKYRQYSRKYSNTLFFKISDKINTSHQTAIGGGKKYSYSAVSRYVTAYLTFS